MGFVSPNNSSEILYGASGDVRNEINAYMAASGAGHYVDETEVPGSLIIRGLERATRMINSYLDIIYSESIPVLAAGDVPLLLNDIASDIGTYFVIRSNLVRMAPMTQEKKRDYYDIHISEKTDEKGTLPQIRDGIIQIPEFGASFPSEVKATREKDRTAIFDLDKETRHEVDPDLLDDIERDRNP